MELLLLFVEWQRLVLFCQQCEADGEQRRHHTTGTINSRISLMNSFMSFGPSPYLFEYYLFIVALYFNQPHNEPIIELNGHPSSSLLDGGLFTPYSKHHKLGHTTHKGIIYAICFLRILERLSHS